MTDIIGRYIDAFFPDVAEDLRTSFERGSWVAGVLPPEAERLRGFDRFLGRVTLYQLQTSLHRDRGDKICATTCAGRFRGGEGIFPDLNVKLA